MPDTSTEGDAGITDAQERIRNAFDGRFERRSRRTRAIVTSVQRDSVGRATGVVATIDGVASQHIQIDHGAPFSEGDVLEVQNQAGAVMPRWHYVRRIQAATPVPTDDEITLPTPTALSLQSGVYDNAMSGGTRLAWIYASWHTLDDSYGNMSYALQVRTNDWTLPPYQQSSDDPRRTSDLPLAITETTTVIPRTPDPDYLIEAFDFPKFGRIRIGAEKIDYTMVTDDEGDSGTGTGSSGKMTDGTKSWTVGTWNGYALIDGAGQVFYIHDSDATAVYVTGTPTSGSYAIHPAFSGCTRGAGGTSATTHAASARIVALSFGMLIRDLQPDIAYNIRVRAFRSRQNSYSAWTSWASITTSEDTTAPDTPTGYELKSEPGGVLLKWTAPTRASCKDLAGFKIYRATSDGGAGSTLIETIGVRSQVFVNHAGTGWTRYYAISAYDYAGNESAKTSWLVGGTLPVEGVNVLSNSDYERKTTTIESYSWQFSVQDWYIHNGIGGTSMYTWEQGYGRIGGRAIKWGMPNGQQTWMYWPWYSSIMELTYPGRDGETWSGSIYFQTTVDVADIILNYEQGATPPGAGDGLWLKVGPIRFWRDPGDLSGAWSEADLGYANNEFIDQYIEPLPDNWYRAHVTVKLMDREDLNPGLQSLIAFQCLIVNYTGSAVTIYLDRAQLEIGGRCTEWKASLGGLGGDGQSARLLIDTAGIETADGQFRLGADGKMHSDMTPGDTETHDLGTESLRWNTIRAVTVVADSLQGAASHDPLALDTDLDANLLDITGQTLSLDTQAANKVFAGPATGAADTPAFRDLVNADVPTALDIETLVLTGPAALTIEESGGGDPVWQIDSDRNLKTANYDDGVEGFKVDADGITEINQIRARGEIRDASFMSRTIAGASILTFNHSGLLAQPFTIPTGTAPEPPPRADFSLSDADIDVDDTVNFTDESTADAGNPIVSWEWDLTGNGLIDSTAEDPSFTYDEQFADQYITVTLTVTADDGQASTETKTACIFVNADDTPPPPPGERVTDGLQVLLLFNEGSGATVADQSGVGSPANFTIQDTGNVSWGEDSLTINSETMLTCSSISKVITACKASDEITLEAFVEPANLTQGLSRIFTISADAALINCGLYQDDTIYVARCRTDTGLESAKPNLITGEVVTQNLSHLVYTRDSSGQERIYLDGTIIVQSERTGDFSTWGSYGATIANEPTGGRSFLGRYALVAVYSKALSAAEVLQNYEAGGGVDPGGPGAPVADFHASDTSIDAFDTVTFYDDSTEDPSNPIVAWWWDLNGDGLLYDAWTSQPSAQFQNDMEGRTWDVSLRVIADDGQENTKTKTRYMTMSGGVVPPLPPGDNDATVIDWAWPYNETHTPTHVVDPQNGNDGNSGTPSAPWKTLGHANSKAGPGMVIGLKPGTYNDCIAPASSGTASNRLVYMAYGTGTVKVVGKSGISSLCELTNRSYVKIQGIRFEPGSGADAAIKTGTWVQISGSAQHVCLRNCICWRDGTPKSLKSSGYRDTQINISGVRYVQIDSCICRGAFLGCKIKNEAEYIFVYRSAFVDHIRHNAGMGDGVAAKGFKSMYYECLFSYAYDADGIQVVNLWDCSSDSDISSSDRSAHCTGWTDKEQDHRKIIVRRCIFRLHGENAIDWKSTKDVFVDECIFYACYSGDSGWAEDTSPSNEDSGFLGATITRGARSTSSDIRWRKNLFYDNPPATKTQGDRWAFFHNTYIANNRHFIWGSDDDWDNNNRVGMVAHRQSASWDELHFINNAVVDQNTAFIAYDDNYDGGAIIDGNLYYDSRGTCGWASSNPSGGWSEVRTLTAWRSQLSGQGITGAEAHSQVKAPKFRYVPNRPNSDNLKHWRLDPRPDAGQNSPLLNAGIDLAVATNSGSNSTNLKVDNAWWFCDGLGIAVGDDIVVGGTTVRISAINYDTNTITLDDQISWTSGDAVNLYQGTGRPTIGAFGPDDDPWWQSLWTEDI